jgi:tight adherence protein B
MHIIIAFLAATTVFLFANSVLLSGGKEKVRNRISKYFNENSAEDVQEQFIREKYEEEQKKKKERIKFVSKDFSNFIISSGLKMTGAEFLIMWGALTLVPMIVIILFGGNTLTAIAVSFSGFAVPPLLVTNARKKRAELFTKQLGEALTVMGNSIKGGFSFLQSMESVSKEMQPPISTEFAKVLREIHFGVSQEEALKHMVERTQSKDLELLVSAVITSSQVGSNLTEILDTIAVTIRERIKIRQEINSLTAQGRISGLVIGALPIVLVLAIMVLNPEYYEGFFSSSIGKLLVVVSILMEATGFILIKKIIDIKM